MEGDNKEYFVLSIYIAGAASEPSIVSHLIYKIYVEIFYLYII